MFLSFIVFVIQVDRVTGHAPNPEAKTITTRVSGVSSHASRLNTYRHAAAEHRFTPRQVIANDWAFAARRDNGQVVCWGDPTSGGDLGAARRTERVMAGWRGKRWGVVGWQRWELFFVFCWDSRNPPDNSRQGL